MHGKSRILVGCLFHESHCFSPLQTGADAFVQLDGENLLVEARAAGTTLGGIVRKLTDLGLEPIAALSAVAPPGGLVDHGFYLEFVDALIDHMRRKPFDAIALELHGAMATTRCRDVEGDLLTRMRAHVGPTVAIAVGLDLHAHITPAMLRAADICIACKQNPHADVVACGERVATLLDALLDGRLQPVTALAKARMILPGNAETSSGPLESMHRQAGEDMAANPSVVDISLFNAFSYGDDVDMGQAAVVTCHADASLAGRLATRFAQDFWDNREGFLSQLPSIEEVLKAVEGGPRSRPFVLADMGDRVLAGAPGDSTAILACCLKQFPSLCGGFIITDAQGATAARAAGLGADLTLAIGGRYTPGFSPLTVTGQVIAITDGVFRIRGPYQAGTVVSSGPSATLRLTGGHVVVLTSKPGFSHDPEAFESQGARIAELDFAVVKSGYHFKLNFAGLGTPLAVATPGISHYVPRFFPWKHARIWPEHDVGDAPLIGAQIFLAPSVNGG